MLGAIFFGEELRGGAAGSSFIGCGAFKRVLPGKHCGDMI
jgi:hypothetical protein